MGYAANAHFLVFSTFLCRHLACSNKTVRIWPFSSDLCLKAEPKFDLPTHPRRPLQDPQRAFRRPHAHFPAALRSKCTTIGSSPSTPPIPPRPKTPQIGQISPSGDVHHTPNSPPTDVNRALCPPSVTNPKSHARILVGEPLQKRL